MTAPFYHLLYGDWEAAVHAQGQALGQLLTPLGIPAGAAVHDAAAGIGTQAIGLLQEGFAVRDYARVERRSPGVRPHELRIAHGRRFLAVKVWEWDQHQYDLRLYLTTEQADGRCTTDVLFQPVFFGRRPA